jgi:hypothetical protein
MAARTVTCPECAKVVPYGRLSCPECGSLLASVVGSERRVDQDVAAYDASAMGGGWPTERPMTVPAPAAPSMPSDLPAPAVRRAATPRAQPRPTNGAPRPRSTAGGMTAAEILGARPMPDAPMPDAMPRTAAPRRTTRADVPLTSTPRPTLAPAMSQSVETSEPDWPAQDQPPISPRATQRPAGERPRAARRPTAQPTNGAAGHPMPAYVDAAPAPTWASQPAAEPLPPSAAFAGAPGADFDAAPRRGSVAAAMTPRPPSASRGGTSPRELLAPLLDQLQIELPDNLSDWLIAAGSGVAALGFLLPWSDAVVGAKGFGGYTDSWGLASPSHVLVLLLVCALLTLSVMPNRVPTWIRSGVLGVLTAGLLIGLVWPYLIAGMGAGLGVMGEAMAAILLIAGGVVAYRDARHDGESDTV